ncbi:MAG: SpoIIE family protein phosphatase [Candidatus Eisenbacteria bacterium]|uniref:SpoIIE family protein phosphatase n=1 Tax=Eiseniibacteriota bacterium TaxID=2212470 RepID=A0A948RW13_UNCEI|nr:SpoIIE family protein phosphatase [Candidatus Eisenbacteria bacterium]MBU1950998.1 SpoIIE family protein phosphatase [Candidatus Eisenbacteria bacterium]MBU2690027.1 SpoIIE family protein phosphatase [Candidatus Eisenbacteria bacterium]
MYVLRGVEDGGPVQWSLTQGIFRIGRSVDSDIRMKDRSISREHAVLKIQDGEITLEDAGSHNGTKVDGQDIRKPTSIQPGAVLQFGSLELQFLRAGDAGDTLLKTTTEMRSDTSLGAAVSLSWDEVQSGINAASGVYQSLFSAVKEAGQILIVPRSLDDLLETMLDIVERAIPPGRLVLLLKEEGHDEPVVRASRPKDAHSQKEMLLSKTIINTVIDNQTSLLVTDVATDPRFQGAESIMTLDLRSAMAVPLFDNKNVIGLIYADTSKPGIHYDRDQLGAFTILANMIAVKISNTFLLEEQRKKVMLEQEMAAAARIQKSLLPATLPQPPGYEMLARQVSCLQTAGDLYEACTLPDGKIGIAVGDVSGKGAGAALLMSHVMAFLRVLYAECSDLTEFAARLNGRIFDCSEPTSFVTLFLGRLNPKSDTLEYVNAGHDAPVIISPDGSMRRLDSTGIPIGLLNIGAYTSGNVEFPLGGLLCVFTDGIPEAQAGEEFYDNERLLEGLKQRRTLPLEEIAAGILGDLKAFIGEHPQLDDITFFLVRRTE